MGEKGSKHSEAGAAAAAAVVDDLVELGDLRGKKMFGGFGLFCEDTMFAIVDPAGIVFLRADDAIVAGTWLTAWSTTPRRCTATAASTASGSSRGSVTPTSVSARL